MALADGMKTIGAGQRHRRVAAVNLATTAAPMRATRSATLLTIRSLSRSILDTVHALSADHHDGYRDALSAKPGVWGTYGRLAPSERPWKRRAHV